MSEDRLTKEERELIEAAEGSVCFAPKEGWYHNLAVAVRAYRASQQKWKKAKNDYGIESDGGDYISCVATASRDRVLALILAGEKALAERKDCQR